MPASALGTGFAMGLGLIAAIGAQNAFVLRQGIRREFIVPVVAICIVSDAILIMAGYFGLGAFLSQQPKLITAMKWLGAAYLVYIGLQSLRNLRSEESLEVSTPDQANGHADATTLHSVAVTTLSLTWLNPHVYLDTVILLGSVAHQHGDHGFFFSLGALLGSIVWFSGLGFGAYQLAPLLSSPRAWRIIEVLVAITMFIMAGLLVTSSI